MKRFKVLSVLVLTVLFSACSTESTPGGGNRPAIASFTASPSTIAAGGTSTLSWNVSGATSLSIDRGVGVMTGSSVTVSPDQTTEYTLTATNAAGSVTAKTTVTVTTGNGTEDPPVIHSFTANPASITAGQSSTLSWSVSGATNLTLNPGNINVMGTDSQAVSPTTTTDYTLTATNAAGSVEATSRVTVTTQEPNETHSRRGFVSLTESSVGGTSFISGSGSFSALDAPQPVPNDEDPFAGFADSCFVYAEGDEVPIPDPTPDPEEVVLLDAGDPLTVRSGSSVYTTLNRQTFEDSIFYSTDFMNPPASPLPGTTMTLTIPGATDGFPAFSDKAFPAVPAFNLTAPEDTSNLTRDTAFAWTGSSSTALVILSGTGQNAEDMTVAFYCIARDDGSFSFPDETKAALDAEGFTTGSLALAGRQSYTRYREGDALLYLSVGRYVSFADFGND